MVIFKILGNNLKLLRKVYKFNQEKMTSYLHVKNRVSITQWESGRNSLSLDMLVNVACFFGTSIDWLLGCSCNPYTNQSLLFAENNLESQLEEYINGYSEYIFMRHITDPFMACTQLRKFWDDFILMKKSNLPYFDYELRQTQFSLAVRANIIVLFRITFLYYFQQSVAVLENLHKCHPERDIRPEDLTPLPSTSALPEHEFFALLAMLVTGHQKFAAYDLEAAIKNAK